MQGADEGGMKNELLARCVVPIGRRLDCPILGTRTVSLFRMADGSGFTCVVTLPAGEDIAPAFLRGTDEEVVWLRGLERAGCAVDLTPFLQELNGVRGKRCRCVARMADGTRREFRLTADQAWDSYGCHWSVTKACVAVVREVGTSGRVLGVMVLGPDSESSES